MINWEENKEKFQQLVNLWNREIKKYGMEFIEKKGKDMAKERNKSIVCMSK